MLIAAENATGPNSNFKVARGTADGGQNDDYDLSGPTFPYLRKCPKISDFYLFKFI